MSITADDVYLIQDFKILDNKGNLAEAAGQFEYKGHQISFSTIGLSSGCFPNPVAIFGGKNRETMLAEVNTVQEAIEWIEDYFLNV